MSNANKIISSQFLFQLNDMIFTYLFVFFHSFVVGFLGYTFLSMLLVLWQSGPVIFLGSRVTFLSYLKAENEKMTAVAWD